ncbi:hypothetical protein KKG18_02885 [Patescibacteria group bacterium]|nr:hypothetical protein [Patescibacteria group bacterium]
MNYNDQNQRHSYDNHTKQNHTNISQQNSREERRSRFVFFARQKAQWNNFCAKTKVRWIRAKKLAKKILHVIMIVHIIVTAVITTIFLLNPLNYWHAYKNPAEMEVLKNADIEARKEMVDAYQRVNRRTDKEKRDEIKRQFEKISGIKDSAKTVTENNFSGAKTVLASSEAQTTTRTVTAYNLVKEQTDNAPCIGAANQNLCYLMREKKMNICASNSHSFGAILKIPGYK